MPDSSSIEIRSELIIETLAPFGASLDENQLQMIRRYIGLLLTWNRSMNLTTITGVGEILQRHFGESMFAARLLPVENCRLADVGSGAGFPGLALKIACPSTEVILIEPNRKKCAFLAEVIRALGFTDVEVWQERFEQIRPENVVADVITTRALGDFKALLGWSKNALNHRGRAILWVGAEDSTRISQIPGWIWQPATRVPESQRRFIMLGRPIERNSPVL